MPIALGTRIEHGFDQPLGLMADCHRRIEHFLEVLSRVSADARRQALTDEHRRAVEASLKYFDQAAPRHTEDEEHSLFPRLRENAQPAVRAALPNLSELEGEHHAANALHAQVRSLFQHWLDSGPLTEAQEVQLTDALHALRRLYDRHIQMEEAEIFPLAGRVLSAEQLAQVGREMARRRGVTSVPADPAG